MLKSIWNTIFDTEAKQERERLRIEQENAKREAEINRIKQYTAEFYNLLQTTTLMRMNPQPVRDIGIVLNQREEVVVHFPVGIHRQIKVGSQYQSGSSGFSVRVAKGVTLRSGGTRGKMVPIFKDETDTGTAVVTNKRVIFVGNSINFSVVLPKIKTVRQSNNTLIFEIAARDVPDFTLYFDLEPLARAFGHYIGDPHADLQNV